MFELSIHLVSARHRSVVCSLPSDPFIWVGGFVIILAVEDMVQ